MTSGRFQMTEASAEHIKKFIFSTNSRHSTTEDIEIIIPEILQAGYSFYTWPCAPILAWFLWDRRDELLNKRILEIGSGTALPGILAAKCGAKVILSDRCTLPKSLSHIQRCCMLNSLQPGKDVEVIGLSWGLLLNNIFNIKTIDYVIGSDCFYDPIVFEDILVTISFIFDQNKNARFIFSYQERSTDWSIESLLKKWNFDCVNINIERVGTRSGIDLQDLMNGHTIHLLEITRR